MALSNSSEDATLQRLSLTVGFEVEGTTRSVARQRARSAAKNFVPDHVDVNVDVELSEDNFVSNQWDALCFVNATSVTREVEL